MGDEASDGEARIAVAVALAFAIATFVHQSVAYDQTLPITVGWSILHGMVGGLAYLLAARLFG